MGGSAVCSTAIYFGGIGPALAHFSGWDPLNLSGGLRETSALAIYILVVMIGLVAGASVLSDGLSRVREVVYEHGITLSTGSLLIRRGKRFVPYEDIIEVEFDRVRQLSLCNLRTANLSFQIYLNALVPMDAAIRRLESLKEHVDSKRASSGAIGPG